MKLYEIEVFHKKLYVIWYACVSNMIRQTLTVCKSGTRAVTSIRFSLHTEAFHKLCQNCLHSYISRLWKKKETYPYMHSNTNLMVIIIMDIIYSLYAKHKSSILSSTTSWIQKLVFQFYEIFGHTYNYRSVSLGRSGVTLSICIFRPSDQSLHLKLFVDIYFCNLLLAYVFFSVSVEIQ